MLWLLTFKYIMLDSLGVEDMHFFGLLFSKSVTTLFYVAHLTTFSSMSGPSWMVTHLLDKAQFF